MGNSSPTPTKPRTRFTNLKRLARAMIRFALQVYYAVRKGCDPILSRFGHHRRRRILIDCIEVFHYHHIKPVVDRLLMDPRLDVFLLDNPNFSPQVVPDHLAHRKHFVTSSDARYRAFDLTISLDYWITGWIPHRGVQIAAPHGGGMKANYNTPERLARYDVVWAVGERQKDNFRKSIANPGALERIGFIVTDQLVNNVLDVTRVRRRLGLNNELPVVLYAPSWSDNPEMILMFEDILAKLHRQDQFNIIVKPHPFLLRPSRAGGKDFGRTLSRLSNERFRVATEADTPIQEYMVAADILISDISSVVFEFLFLDRPILLHTNSRVIGFYEGEDYLKDILPAVSLFETAAQLPAKLQMAFGNPNRLSLERKRFVAREYYNVGRATDAAVSSVYRHLELEPLDSCAASRKE